MRLGKSETSLKKPERGDKVAASRISVSCPEIGMFTFSEANSSWGKTADRFFGGSTAVGAGWDAPHTPK